jgi:hypothetical protein
MEVCGEALRIHHGDKTNIPPTVLVGGLKVGVATAEGENTAGEFIASNAGVEGVVQGTGVSNLDRFAAGSRTSVPISHLKGFGSTRRSLG